MGGPVFINLAVDRPSAVCVHAQLILGVPIDEMNTLCTFRTFERASEKDEYVRLTRMRVQSKTGVFHDSVIP